MGKAKKARGTQEGCSSIFFIATRQNKSSNTTNYAELQNTSNTSPGGVQGGNENREKHISSVTLKIQFWR